MDNFTSLIRAILDRANALAALALTALTIWLLQGRGYFTALPVEFVQFINVAGIFAAALLLTGFITHSWQLVRAKWRVNREIQIRRERGLQNFETMPERFRTVLAYYKHHNEQRFMAYAGNTLVREMVLHGLIDPDDPHTLHEDETYFVIPEPIWQRCGEMGLGEVAQGIPHGLRLGRYSDRI